MSGRAIQRIDGQDVHSICSGQVIFDLCTAVKELVENSLDAGATQIEVRFFNQGADLFEVSDNGRGIAEEDFEVVARKAFTSKLDNFERLPEVSAHSFGFRGEALSALASVGELAITTRTAASHSAGFALSFDRMGYLQSKTAAARGVGTSVRVRRLFGHLPVRAKDFHANLAREFRKAVGLLEAYAIVRADVRFRIYDLAGETASSKKGKLLIATKGAPATLRDAIACVWGAKEWSALQELPPAAVPVDDSGSIEVSGYLSGPGVGRTGGDHQLFYVNGRPVNFPELSRVLNAAFRQQTSAASPIALKSRYPAAVLLVKIPAQLVDVNVAPDKRSVFVTHSQSFLQGVQHVFAQFYGADASAVPLAQLPQTATSSADLLDTPPLDLTTVPADLLTSPVNESPRPLLRRRSFTSSLSSSSQTTLSSSSQTLLSSSSQTLLSSSSQTLLSSSSQTLLPSSSQSVRSPSSQTLLPPSSQTTLSSSLLPSSNQPIRSPSSQALLSTRLPSGGLSATSLLRTKRDSEREADSPRCLKRARTLPLFNVDDDRADEAEDSNTVQWSRCVDSGDVDVLFDEPGTGTDRWATTISAPQSAVERAYAAAVAAEQQAAVESPGGATKQPFFKQLAVDSDAECASELQQRFSKSDFDRLDVLGQFNLGFIVARLNSHLFIVDQHASDEKYNFERLQAGTSLQQQALLVPKQLQLSAVEEMTVIDNMAVFQRNGFDFRVDDEAPPCQRLALTRYAYSRNTSLGVDDIHELIALCQERPGEDFRCSKVLAMYAMRACRTSIMIGTALNAAQMRSVLKHLGQLQMPWACPHGRPTFRHLYDLDRHPLRHL